MRLIGIALALASFIGLLTAPSKAASLPDKCGDVGAFSAAAAQNAEGSRNSRVAPFGRAERGWIVYAAQAGRAIDSACSPDSSAFAAALATWQGHNGLRVTGVMDAATLSALKRTWQQSRPFISGHGPSCPRAAEQSALSDTKASEGWGGKATQLDARALAALREMIAAARASDPAIAANPQMLTIVSAFRSPAYDAAACARGANCNGVAKARCSAHRTGYAVDLFVGAAPGQSPVSSNDANRLFQSRSPAYLWLVRNARRFGFVNYVFEPWHWEWIGPDSTFARGDARAR